MYVRFLRWASNRLNKNGIIAFITNSSFVDSRAFDGFRKSVQAEFNYIYILDLGGNVRTISGKDGIFISEKHTIFGTAAMTGIAIVFLVKDTKSTGNKIFYSHPFHIHELRENKLNYLKSTKFKDIDFTHIIPDQKYNWINQTDNDFDNLLPLIDKEVKTGKAETAIFRLFSRGVATQRDEWVYDLSLQTLQDKIKFFVDIYQQTLKDNNYVDKFQIKWDRELTKYLDRKILKHFDKNQIVTGLYRPYFKQYFYFDKHFNGMTYQWFNIYQSERENYYICLSGIGSSKNFQTLGSHLITGLDCLEKTQCLPLYSYTENGEKIDNITDWGLNQFQTHYQDKNIKKIDIFHYVYAVLHHPKYQQKYEQNLKRDFPRIPFYDNFYQWVKWGEKLMDLHINYETVKPYQFTRVDLPVKSPEKTPKTQLKADKIKGSIIIDDITTLAGIPKIAWEYKLGNRCALEWVLDQYKEKKPKDPTIAERFNTYKFADYKEEVIELLQRVCTVSIETMKIIASYEE